MIFIGDSWNSLNMFSFILLSEINQNFAFTLQYIETKTFVSKKLSSWYGIQ